jgi:hypothetical protein
MRISFGSPSLESKVEAHRALAIGVRPPSGCGFSRTCGGESGAYRDRTDDLRLAKAALSQLS